MHEKLSFYHALVVYQRNFYLVFILVGDVGDATFTFNFEKIKT